MIYAESSIAVHFSVAVIAASVKPYIVIVRDILSKHTRVRVTDRHCRHLRRKIKFGTKNHKLAKTSGEKNITWITRYWVI